MIAVIADDLSGAAGLIGNATGVGIDIPDIATQDDIEASVAALPHTVLPAGAADYFAAILRKHGLFRSDRHEPFPNHHGSALWICGSQTAWSGGLSGAVSRCRDFCG